MAKTLLNVIGIYAGWYACVYGAASGDWWIGPLYVGVFLAIHLYLTPNRRSEAQFILLAGLIGAVVDGLLRLSGVVIYRSAVPLFGFVGPWWIIAMWMLFASTFSQSLAWLKQRLMIGGLLGAVFGPLSYIAGARLGAAEFGVSQSAAVSALAFIWAIAVPLLAWLSARPYFAAVAASE